MSHEFKNFQEERLERKSILDNLGFVRAESEAKDVFRLRDDGSFAGLDYETQKDVPLDRPERLLAYFEQVPVAEPDPICRPKGDATLFTSAGIQQIETILRREKTLKKTSFKVVQPSVRSQYMDKAREGTSTAFVDFTVASVQASPSEYVNLSKNLIALMVKEGASPGELRFKVDDTEDTWGTKKLKKTTLTISVKDIEVGESIYIHDYPMTERKKIPLVDACFGVERFSWAIGKNPYYFTGFETSYEKDGGGIDPNRIAAIIDCVRTSVLLAGEGIKAAHRDPGYRLRQLAKRFTTRNEGIRLDVEALIHAAYAYWIQWGFRPTVSEDNIVKVIKTENDRSYNVWLVTAVKDRGGPNIQVDVNQSTEAFLAKIQATFPKDIKQKIAAILASLS